MKVIIINCDTSNKRHQMVDIYQFKMECNKGVGETGINEVREITFYDTMLNKFNMILHRSSIRCQYLSCCSKV